MNSIRSKLVVPLLAGILLLSTLGAVLLYFSMRQALTDQFDQAMYDKAAALASLVHVLSDGRIEFDYSDENFAEFRRADSPQFFQIRLSDGKILQRSATKNGADLTPFDPSRAGAEALHQPAQIHDVILPNGRSGRLISITRRSLVDQDDDNPVAPGKIPGASDSADPTLPIATISVARDTHEMNQTLNRLRNALMIGVAALAACVAALVPQIIRRALRPLDAIAQHAQSLNANSLNSAFPQAGLPTELIPITQRLNELLNRLSASFARETRFSANAAHELRTPIAEIRTVAEVALQWPEIERSQRALADVVDVSAKMHLLIDALLKLARARGGGIALAQSPLSPSDAAEKTLAALAAVVQRKQLNVRLESVGTPAALSNPAALSDPALASAMIANLVANAVHHAPSRGQIEIEEAAVKDSVVLTIVNDCAPGAQPDIKLLCEPFWTGSVSRTDQRHGLGLALVREYATLLDTPLSFDLRDGKFRATVQFRAAGAQNLDALQSNAAP